MKHTRLTPFNYSTYTLTIFFTGLLMVGYGAVDLIMIAPFGLTSVAAVGLGEVVNSGFTALLAIGIIDVFAGRLAKSEGSNKLGKRLSVLGAALALLILAAQTVAVLLALLVEPILGVLGQDEAVVPLAADYVWARATGLGLTIVYVVLNEAMKICGMKSTYLVILAMGFGGNIAMNVFFLSPGVLPFFASPVAAIAYSTVCVQLLVAIITGVVFLRAMKKRGETFAPLRWRLVRSEAVSMGRVAPGIGIRHFNDNTGTLAITLLLGTLGVQSLAAATLATKIWSLFCRIPQACVSGTFVFYAYESGREKNKTKLARHSNLLLRYAMLPTAMGVILIGISAPLIVSFFSGAGTDQKLTTYLVYAFLCTVPFYLIENHYGEILSVMQRGNLQAAASSVSTYLVAIPLAGVATFFFDSAFLVVLSSAVPSMILGSIFLIEVRRSHRKTGENAVATDPVFSS